MTTSLSRIALTVGEPSGIGPDICLQIDHHDYPCQLVVIADPLLLEQRANCLGLKRIFEPVDLHKPATIAPQGVIRYLPERLAVDCSPGKLDSRNAQYVLNTLVRAHDGCVATDFSAMVTAPVHKGVINDAEIPFTGHTEFLAHRANVDKVVMMLATPLLRVALASTHLPLAQVPQAITPSSLNRIITILHNCMGTQFGIKHPRIAVCGLNPHAGEGGHLGREEIDIIEPVITHFKQKNIAISGPWPADTVFVEEKLKQFDVILAMYHDQGLPVLKHRGFGQAVNVTLGLPYIRTSVDHGTALELAGSGQASTSSLHAAITMAINMTSHQNAQ